MNADTILKLAREAAAKVGLEGLYHKDAISGILNGDYDDWNEVQSALAMAPLVIAAIADELDAKAKTLASYHAHHMMRLEAACLRASIEQKEAGL